MPSTAHAPSLFSSEECVADLFLHHLSNGKISFDHVVGRDSKKRKLSQILKIILEKANDLRNRFVNDSLTFLLGFLDEKHQNLYNDYIDRVLYKRLFEKLVSAIRDETYRESIRRKFDWEQRKALIATLESKLLACVYKTIDNQSVYRPSLIRDIPRERIEELQQNRLLLIIDTPLRRLSEPKGGIYVLKDKDRKNGLLAIDKTEVNDVVNSSKMNEIIFYRILAQPDFYEILIRFVRQEDIDKIICEVFPEFG